MKVTILTTGGTIASRSVGGMAKGSEVVSTVPGLENIAEVTQEEFCVVASSQMTPRMMFDLSRRAAEILSGDADGVVITHGTDTMEETVYMLDMVVPGVKPVIITGAMRTAEQLGSDGPQNVFAAVATAASTDAKSRPAMLVLNDEIHAARWVQKVHSSNPRAFESPAHGRIGEVHNAKAVFYEAPRARMTLNPKALNDTEALVPDVDLVSLYAGADDRLIRASLNSGAHGIVVEFMGKGNAPRAVVPGLEACRKAGVPVVVVTRCPAGQVEIERYERELGCINGGELSGFKARLRLMLALGAAGPDAGAERVRPFFA